MEKKLNANYTRMLLCFQQFLGATPQKTAVVRPFTYISQTIKIRRTRHAGHCWRSKNKLIIDLLTHTHIYIYIYTSVAKGELGTRACNPLSKQRRALLSASRNFASPSPPLNVMITNFKVRKYTSINRPRFRFDTPLHCTWFLPTPISNTQATTMTVIGSERNK